MSGVKKARHLEILGAAKATLFAYGGTVRTDAMNNVDRSSAFREMARLIRGKAGCHIDTAKRNLAKAMSQDRYRRMQEKSDNADNWGGQRPLAGRPKKEGGSE